MTQSLSKDINYRLTADPSGLERGFKSAERSASVFERELAKLEARQRRVDRASTDIGRGMLLAGGAIGAGLALATRAAMQWETAWTGVVKVVTGTPAQLDALEGQLRDLTSVLPQTHEEIAGVAAAAGQLGVARKDIAEFTHTMVDLGTSTNLSSTEAADGLARLMNIMQTSPENVRRLGSALVDLGNNAAATESEILEMGLRIAGAGHVIGLSEAQVLSFATALSSVGIDAEAGGSSISHAFIAISQAVKGGGEALQSFAEVAGVSAGEFQRRFETDAAGAITAFVEGLGRVKASGGDVFATLEALGLSEIRVRDALLRLSGAGTLLGETLKVGNEAWEKNNALTEEAERRYQTTEARLAIARNQMHDFAIDLGQTMLPALGKAADLLGDLAGVLGDLPGPLKAALAILGALSAALLLTGGTALLAVPKIAAYKAAIDTLAESEGRLAAATVAAAGKLGRIGSILAGPWGIALAAAVAVVTAFGVAQANTRARVDELAGTLDDQTGAITDNTRALVVSRLEGEGWLKWATQMGISLDLITDAAMGDTAAMGELRGIFADLSATASDESKPAIDRMADSLGVYTDQIDAARESTLRKKDALGETADEAARTDPAVRNLAEAFNLSATEAKDAAAELKNFSDELDNLLGSLFDVEEATDGLASSYQQLADKVKEAVKAHTKGAKDLAGNTQAARDNRDAVRDLVRKNFELIDAYAQQGATADEIKDKAKTLRGEFIKQLTQMGFNETQVRDYARAFDQIPQRADTSVHVITASARAAIADIAARIRAIASRTVYIHGVVRWTSTGLRVPGGTILQRAGGVWEHAATGLVRDATFIPESSPGTYLVAEPGTGGEGFLPRRGIPQSRALDVLDRMAAWYDLAVAPRGGAAAGGHPTGGGSGGGWAGPGLTEAILARALRAALMGVHVELDGTAVGVITGRNADRYTLGL